MDSRDEIFRVLQELTREAGLYALDHFKKLKSSQIHYKGAGKTAPVSDIDLAIDEMIRYKVGLAFPNHAVLSEESKQRKESDVVWIIDPIDGTRNYINNDSHYNTSIAVEINGRVEMGATYAPSLEEFYLARRGEGFWLNDKLVQKNLPPTRRCFCGKEKFVPVVQNNPLTKDLTPQWHGSVALEIARTAAGMADACIYGNIGAWDYSAGSLMIEEVGGKLFKFDGEPFERGEKNFIALRLPNKQ